MLQLAAFSIIIATALAGTRIFEPRLNGRIIGGRDADIEDYPYQISLLWYGNHICGGSIIHPKYIVTAAQCTDRQYPAVLSIRAGSSLLKQDGTVVHVARIHQHPEYNSRLKDYDITVLELAVKLTYSSTIRNINLPVQNQVIPDFSEAEISGWGNNDNGDLQTILQVVSFKTLRIESCYSAFGRYRITDRMICAGEQQIRIEACPGDVGGPLTVNGQLIGITSWGTGCPHVPISPDHPGVYTNVPYLRSFIAQVSGV